jgi:uncharacterized cupredoxin-like copper-binding protein
MKNLLLLAFFVFAQAAQAAGEHSGGHNAGGHGSAAQHGGHSMPQGHSGAHASNAGEPGKAAQATRTIDVVMGEPSEFRFTPERIEVKAGETVLFRVRNAGKLPHEMVLGDAAELQEHAKAMRAQAGMAHKDANSLTLDPGKAGELVWKFTNAGEFEFACLVAGHYEAGMKGSAIVN